MGLHALRQIVFVFNVLAIYHAGHGCSEPRNWRSKGVSMRAIHADIVILGKVVQSPFPSRQRSPQFGPYDARFRIWCALKGKPRAKYVNVSGFGYVPGHCVSSPALGNETYITLLRKRYGHYFIAEINSQVGTIPFRKSILRKVMKRLRRKGELNRSRNSCAAFFRTARKSAKVSAMKFKNRFKVEANESNAFKTISDNASIKNINRAFNLMTIEIDRNRCIGFKSSWLVVVLVGVHCVGHFLT